jgi:hypothetical protein
MNVKHVPNGKGKPDGVFIPMEDWEVIRKELASKSEIPDWHKEILSERMVDWQSGKTKPKDAGTVLKELESGL